MATIALLEPLPDSLRQALRRHLPAGAELREVESGDEAEAQRLAAEAEVLLVWNGPLPSATLAAGRQAKLAQVCDRRPRGVDFRTARSRKLPLAGPGAAGARSAAEHALLLALAGLRGLSAALANLGAKRSPLAPAAPVSPTTPAAPITATLNPGTREAPASPALVGQRQPSRELRGLSLGLFGLDAAARELAGLARALGMSVIGWDPGEAEPPPGVEPLRRYEVLAGADVVSLHLPPTPDQRGVIGREALRLLRRQAVLVNVAGAELIDELSLYQALANGRLAAAGLDDLADFDAPRPGSLRELPSVLVTPRLATATATAIEELAAAAMANAARVLDSQEPLDRWA